MTWSATEVTAQALTVVAPDVVPEADGDLEADGDPEADGDVTATMTPPITPPTTRAAPSAAQGSHRRELRACPDACISAP
jgi:hypothetical protein